MQAQRQLYMFYAGGYNNEPQQIGCAVSEDGVSWKRLFRDPFLPNGKNGDWNASESGHPYAFTDDDGTTYLFYQGNNDHGKSWFLSKVRIGWEDGRPFVETKSRASADSKVNRVCGRVRGIASIMPRPVVGRDERRQGGMSETAICYNGTGRTDG
jgi:hypothetical protein